VRRLLVTGGAGFIGANFVHYWLQRHPGERLVLLDALTYAGNLASIAAVKNRPEVRFVHDSICNTEVIESLLREENVDTIVHFAAESHVDRSIVGPDAFIETNVIGTHSLLKAARTVWLKEKRVAVHRFHHVSTDEVYGSLGPSDPAFTEETPYTPNSPYSASKAASDHLVRAYHHTYGLSTTISNCSNNYGPYQFPEKLIPLMIINALSDKPLPIYGDGMNVRDWLHVEDHCRAIELILENGRAGDTYNVGGDSERNNKQVVAHICAVLDDRFRRDRRLEHQFPEAPPVRGRSMESLITFVTDRPGHDRRYAIDATKLKRELGFAPTREFENGVRDTIDWFLANRTWWSGVLHGSYRHLHWLAAPQASSVAVGL
jgi:dTDP-glucose 4,6-dehydratase